MTRCLESDPSLTPRLPDAGVFLANELSWKLGIELSPYDRSKKSESYSNKFDLRSMAGKCFLDAYRFTVTAECTKNKAKPDGRKQFGSSSIWDTRRKQDTINSSVVVVFNRRRSTSTCCGIGSRYARGVKGQDVLQTIHQKTCRIRICHQVMIYPQTSVG